MNMKIAGKILKDTRKAHGLTLQDVARMSKNSTSFVQSLEQGKYHDTGVNALKRIVKALGYSIQDFLALVEEHGG
jgi:transcriptional regulator with XRE-family HTH domain